MHFKNNTYTFAFEFQIQSLMKPNMKNYSKHLSVTFLFFLSCVLCPAPVSVYMKNETNQMNELFEANVEALASGESDRDTARWIIYEREDGGYNCCGGGNQKCR